MAGVSLFSVLLPGDPAISVVTAEGTDVQRQWVAGDLLLNLFSTSSVEKATAHCRDPEKTAQVAEFHREVFPGEAIPGLLLTKHEADQGFAKGQNQPFYLKEKTLPTTVAWSWIAWAVSYPRRQPPERKLANACFSGLVQHCLEGCGSLQFDMQAVGSREAVSREVRYPGGTFSVDDVWGTAVRARLRPAWKFLRDAGVLTSDFQRPSLADVILFGLQPKKNDQYARAYSLVRPLALSLLRQFVRLLDSRMPELSLESLAYRKGMEKNRARQQVALRLATTAAGMYYLFDNASWT